MLLKKASLSAFSKLQIVSFFESDNLFFYRFQGKISFQHETGKTG